MRLRPVLALAMATALTLTAVAPSVAAPGGPGNASQPARISPKTPAGDLTPVPELDTPTARHFRRGDGDERVAKLALVPEQVRDAEGNWVTPSGEIVETDKAPPGFRYRSDRGAYVAHLPATAGGSVRLERGSLWLEFGMGEGSQLAPRPAETQPAPPGPNGPPVPRPAPAGPAPERKGHKATYRYTGRDLRYEYEADLGRFKESIILEKPRAEFDVRIPLAMSAELTAVAQDGEIHIWRKDFPGMPAFVIERGWAEDAKGRRTDATQEVVEEAGQQYLRLALDSKWLADPDRAFPVLVDPTVRLQGDYYGVRGISNQSDYSTTPDYYGGVSISRNAWFGDEARSIVRFDLTSVTRQPVGRIRSAVLQVGHGWQGGSGTVVVHSLARPWHPNGVSWRYADRYAGTTWKSPGGDIASTLASFPFSNGGGSVDVSSLVRSWVVGGAEATGFLFACAESYCSGYVNAALEVTYDLDTSAPAAAIASHGNGATLSGTTTVSASATDNYGVDKVELLVDGAVVATDTAVPYAFDLNTVAFPAGEHTLAARAWDQAGNPAVSAPVHVTFGGLQPIAAPATGPDPSPPQPAMSPTYLSSEELGLDSRWGYVPLPAPGAYLRLSNGNMVLTAADSVLPGPGLATTFRRTYNSRDNGVKSFGSTWFPNFQQRLILSANTIWWLRSDGGSVRYVLQADGSWKSAVPGLYDRLVPQTGGYYDIQRKDGSVHRFRPDGQLETMTDRNGNRITYAYGSKLSSVTDSAGRNHALAYNATGYVSAITDAAGRTFNYEYSGSRLVRVTGPASYSWHYGYHAGTGFLTSVTDPTGRRYRFDYDTSGRLTGVQDPAGYWTRYSYSGTEVAVTSPLGSVSRYGVNAAGQLSYSADPLGNRTVLAYDANYRVASVTDPTGAVTSIGYDAMGNPTSVRDALGSTTTTIYNSLNLPTAVTDPLGNVTRMEYDARGNLTRSVDPAGAATTYGHDSRGLRTSAASPVGGTTYYGYDSYGRLTQVTDPLGAITRHAYSSMDLPVNTTDPRGGITYFEYDPLGGLHRVRYPGSLLESEFSVTDAAGRVLRQIDAAGGHTTVEYDVAGRAVKVTDPLGRASRAEYDADGRLIAIIDPLGNRTTQSYDAAGRLTAVADPLGHTTRAAYDVAGRQTAVIDPTGATTSFTYDLLGRQTAVTNPLGARAAYSYDALGRVIAYTNPLGAVTRYGYDTRSLLSQVTDALNGVTRYTHDAGGRRTAVTDALGRIISFAYDVNGRMVQETRPGGLVARQGYDAMGNRTSYTDFNGRTTYYTYDARNRLATTQYPRDGQVTFAYDGTGRRTRMTDPLGFHTWTYDAAGQLVRARDWMGYTLAYEYDAGGRRTRAGAQTYSYDAAGRMASGPGVTYSYDSRGLVTQKTLASGVRQLFAYDGAGMISEIRALKSTGADFKDPGAYYYPNDWSPADQGLAHLRYQRDAQGQIIRILQRFMTAGWVQSQAFSYDALGRLSRAEALNTVTTDYEYDTVGNRTRAGASRFTYDANNRMTSEQNWYYRSFQYDNNGNMTAKSTEQGSYGYNYDDENRMTVENIVSYDWWCDAYCTPRYNPIARHWYNGDGLRARSERYSYETANTYSHYDGTNLLAETRFGGSEGGPLAYYYRGRGGESVAVRNLNGNLYEHLLDDRGGVRWLVSSTKLTPSDGYCSCDLPEWLSASYRNDPFGNDAGSSYGTAYNPLRYNGARYEPDSKMYLMGARYYIPQAGRFLTQDSYRGTAWEPWTQHLYMYTGNNPINYVDPTGHSPESAEARRTVSLTIQTFLPVNRINNPDPITRFLRGFKQFSGDGVNRTPGDGGNFRTTHTVQIDLDSMEVIGSKKDTGVTTAYDEKGNPVKSAKADGDSVGHIARKDKDGNLVLLMLGDEGIPLVPWAPKISYRGSFTVAPDGSVNGTFMHNRMPGYEVFANDQLIYGFSPPEINAHNLWDFRPWEKWTLGYCC